MKRREFIVAAAALPLVACVKPAPKADYRYFNEIEARVMDAWLERLLPGNTPPGTPGARDAGVLTYIDGQMLLPRWTPVARATRRSVARLQEAAKVMGVAHFAELAVGAQDELLVRMQNGSLTDTKVNMQKTFQLVWEFALEGFLGDAKYGGNKANVVWTSLGESPACPH